MKLRSARGQRRIRDRWMRILQEEEWYHQKTLLQALKMIVGHVPVASFAVAVCKPGLSYPGIIIIKTPITIY